MGRDNEELPLASVYGLLGIDLGTLSTPKIPKHRFHPPFEFYLYPADLLRLFLIICPRRNSLDSIATMYVRQEKLPGLKEYKYSSVDRSLTSKYILKPFYTNVVIKCFPMSMAPNAITLTGFAFVIINFLTLLWFNPGLDQDCPSWVYYSWAIGLFLYQTFDAVDGTQA